MDRDKLIKKVQKDHGSFADSVQGLSVEQLKENFNIYNRHRFETERAKEEREQEDDIKSLKDTIKNELAPYTDSIGAYKLKIKFLALLIKDKGGVLSPELSKEVD